jgi:hypothetical protein
LFPVRTLGLRLKRSLPDDLRRHHLSPAPSPSHTRCKPQSDRIQPRRCRHPSSTTRRHTRHAAGRAPNRASGPQRRKGRTAHGAHDSIGHSVAGAPFRRPPRAHSPNQIVSAQRLAISGAAYATNVADYRDPARLYSRAAPASAVSRCRRWRRPLHRIVRRRHVFGEPSLSNCAEVRGRALVPRPRRASRRPQKLGSAAACADSGTWPSSADCRAEGHKTRAGLRNDCPIWDQDNGRRRLPLRRDAAPSQPRWPCRRLPRFVAGASSRNRCAVAPSQARRFRRRLPRFVAGGSSRNR